MTDGHDLDFIYIWYQNDQPIYNEWKKMGPKIIFHQGIPEDETEAIEKLTPLKTNLLVIDDLDVLSKDRSDFLAQLFNVFSHHRNTSIIFTTHHLFSRDKRSVVLSRNSDYLILFANPRDSSAIKRLGYQCKPNNSKFLPSAFEMATSTPYGILVCDWKAGTPEQFRFRQTLSAFEPIIIFVEKSYKHEKETMKEEPEKPHHFKDDKE